MWLAESLIPRCECRLIEGVGHFLHFERPEVLADYEDFLLQRDTPMEAPPAPVLREALSSGS